MCATISFDSKDSFNEVFTRGDTNKTLGMRIQQEEEEEEEEIPDRLSAQDAYLFPVVGFTFLDYLEYTLHSQPSLVQWCYSAYTWWSNTSGQNG